LTLWHSWSGAQLEALNSVARSYEQAHPDVRISLQPQPKADIIRNYGMSVADGSAPQLLLTLGRYIGELAERQHVAPLNDLLPAETLSDLIPQAAESASAAGQLYGIPIAFDTQVLFYDRRRVATPPTTLDEAIALNEAQRAEPLETRPWSLGYHLSLETTLPYLSAFGGVVLDQQQPVFATQSREATLRWLEWLRSLQVNENVIASPDFSAVDAAIQQNRVLSVIDWSHRRANYERLWGADAVGVAPMPAVQPDVAPQPLILPDVICVNTVISPEQRSAALDFIRYLIAQPAQETLWSRGQLLPVHRAAKLAAEAQPFREIALGSQPLRSEVAATAVWRPLNDVLRSVLFNTATPAEALDSASAALQKQQP
jgi:maltose-binding protein MalE